jgi:hypothetical protein
LNDELFHFLGGERHSGIFFNTQSPPR